MQRARRETMERHALVDEEKMQNQKQRVIELEEEKHKKFASKLLEKEMRVIHREKQP